MANVGIRYAEVTRAEKERVSRAQAQLKSQDGPEQVKRMAAIFLERAKADYRSLKDSRLGASSKK